MLARTGGAAKPPLCAPLGPFLALCSRIHFGRGNTGFA